MSIFGQHTPPAGTDCALGRTLPTELPFPCPFKAQNYITLCGPPYFLSGKYPVCEVHLKREVDKAKERIGHDGYKCPACGAIQLQTGGQPGLCPDCTL